MSWPWPKVIRLGHWQKRAKFCVCSISFWLKILQTKTAYDLRVYHDIDPMLFLQSQGHWQEKGKIHVRFVTFFVETFAVSNLHRDSLQRKVVSWTWPKGSLLKKCFIPIMFHVLYKWKWLEGKIWLKACLSKAKLNKL